MLGRQFRTRLFLLQPDLPHVEEKQQLAKPVRPTKFSNGDHVFIRNYGVNRRVKWIPGRITSSVGTRMFNVCWRGPLSSCRSDAPQGQSLAHVFAATSRRVPFSGSYATGYTNTGYTKMRDADKGRPTRCSQCRIASASPQHTRSPSAEHVFTIARNCGKEMLCFRFDLILLRTFCRVWHSAGSSLGYDIGRIRLVKFRPTILGSAHPRTDKMLLTEAGQSNGKFCPRSNWKHYLDWNLTCSIYYH